MNKNNKMDLTIKNTIATIIYKKYIVNRTHISNNLSIGMITTLMNKTHNKMNPIRI